MGLGIGNLGELYYLLSKYGPAAVRVAIAAIKLWLKRRKQTRRKQASPPKKGGGRPTRERRSTSLYIVC